MDLEERRKRAKYLNVPAYYAMLSLCHTFTGGTHSFFFTRLCCEVSTLKCVQRIKLLPTTVRNAVAVFYFTFISSCTAVSNNKFK
ncbi:hypothetical protein V5799_010491 [Amblyomma americanum]|uniref:Uncharacterized protein n=1 Tax=Amblyomma americanum TaxID=6943 RepID=A0AAQ4EJL3_AMBAM